MRMCMCDGVSLYVTVVLALVTVLKSLFFQLQGAITDQSNEERDFFQLLLFAFV